MALSRLLGMWLEQFDRIARWVLQQDLVPAYAGYEVVPEVDPGLAQGLDHRWQPGNLDRDAVPAAGLGLGAIGMAWPPPRVPRGR
jgi:hypothetical protein